MRFAPSIIFLACAIFCGAHPVVRAGTTTLFSLLISSRRAADPSSDLMGVRFCLHLAPLNFGD